MSENSSINEPMSDDVPRWYVLRFLYHDQPKVRCRFEQDGIETFSPARPVIECRDGRRIKVWKPLVWDLFFVHSTKTQLDPYVAAYDNFQYRYKVGGRYKEPLVVPDKQMDDFVRAVGSSENPLYFTPQELNVSKGTRIRIIGGAMNGYEGVVMKVKGARAKRLIVEIPDTLIAAIEVQPDLIEILK